MNTLIASQLLVCNSTSVSEIAATFQLLGCTLRHDRPELETRRGDLLREEERLRARLDQLQENLLLELAGAQGDVLQNKVNVWLG